LVIKLAQPSRREKKGSEGGKISKKKEGKKGPSRRKRGNKASTKGKNRSPAVREGVKKKKLEGKLSRPGKKKRAHSVTASKGGERDGVVK